MTVTEIAEHLSFEWGFVISAIVLLAAGVVWIFAPETRVVGQAASDAWETGGPSELA
jgi:MFS transporter, ACDE family, multidrug resistance protein